MKDLNSTRYAAKRPRVVATESHNVRVRVTDLRMLTFRFTQDTWASFRSQPVAAQREFLRILVAIHTTKEEQTVLRKNRERFTLALQSQKIQCPQVAS